VRALALSASKPATTLAHAACYPYRGAAGASEGCADACLEECALPAAGDMSAEGGGACGGLSLFPFWRLPRGAGIADGRDQARRIQNGEDVHALPASGACSPGAGSWDGVICRLLALFALAYNAVSLPSFSLQHFPCWASAAAPPDKATIYSPAVARCDSRRSTPFTSVVGAIWRLKARMTALWCGFLRDTIMGSS
jgi:hypothetical protein